MSDETTSFVTKASQEKTVLNESGYIVEISDSLYAQITNQINLFREIDVRHSMQSFATEAIREKMIAEQKGGIAPINKPKVLNLLLSERLRLYIESRVEQYKKTRKSYSKKKWILDAITEKLARDQANIKNLIDEMYPPKGK